MLHQGLTLYALNDGSIWKVLCSQYQLKVLIINAVLTDLDLDRAEKSDRAMRFDEPSDLMVIVSR